MELIIKNDSNVKLVIYKDEIVISTMVGKGNQSSPVVQKADGISVKVGI